MEVSPPPTPPPSLRAKAGKVGLPLFLLLLDEFPLPGVQRRSGVGEKGRVPEGEILSECTTCRVACFQRPSLGCRGWYCPRGLSAGAPAVQRLACGGEGSCLNPGGPVSSRWLRSCHVSRSHDSPHMKLYGWLDDGRMEGWMMDGWMVG